MAASRRSFLLGAAALLAVPAVAASAPGGAVEYVSDGVTESMSVWRGPITLEDIRRFAKSLADLDARHPSSMTVQVSGQMAELLGLPHG